MAKPASPSDKPKPSAAKSAAAKTAPSQKDLEVAAYYNWVNRGCTHGEDQKDWFEAQKEQGKKK